jgi:DNA replication protein DnaC
LLAQWDEWGSAPWLERLLDAEEAERGRRSFERRVAEARLGSFKSLADFDWQWPSRIDRALVEELLGLGFLEDASNVVLVGPNGVGKTMLAQNLAYQALLGGHTAFCS